MRKLTIRAARALMLLLAMVAVGAVFFADRMSAEEPQSNEDPLDQLPAPPEKDAADAVKPIAPYEPPDYAWTRTLGKDLEEMERTDGLLPQPVERALNPQVRRQLEIRRDTLNELYDAAVREYERNQRSIESLLRIAQKRRDVKLELASNSARRLGAMDEYLERVTILERQARHAAQKDSSTDTAYLAARDARIEAKMAVRDEQTRQRRDELIVAALSECERGIRQCVRKAYELFKVGAKGGETSELAPHARLAARAQTWPWLAAIGRAPSLA